MMDHGALTALTQEQLLDESRRTICDPSDTAPVSG
jgi:hypothetical protein